MVETIWIYAEKDGFLSGWSSSEALGAIEVPRSEDLTERLGLQKINLEFIKWLEGIEIEENSYYPIELTNKWMDMNPNESLFIFDESNVLDVEKQKILEEAKIHLEQYSENGLKIVIDGIEYSYPYNIGNKNYLNKIHDILEKGYLDTATFTFRQDGRDVSKELDKTNIHELWVLSYLHEEGREKRYSKVLEEINLVRTLDELMILADKIREM